MADNLPSVLLNSFECNQGSVRAVRFNVDGGYCITCGADKSVKLWNPYSGSLLHKYAGHGYEVSDARGSVDNSLIVSGGLDKSLMVWDVMTGQCRLKLRGHYARINCICFNEDSSVVLSGSLDKSVRIWDLRSKRRDPIQVLDEAKDSITSVSVSSHEILTSSIDGNIRIYDIRNGKLTANCIGAAVTCCTFSGDSQCVLTATSDSKLRLMDKESGEMLNSYHGHDTKDYKMDCCLTSSDTHVLSGSADSKVYCWDLISAKLSHTLDHDGKCQSVVHSLSSHPSEPKLLTSQQNKIFLWGPTEEKEAD